MPTVSRALRAIAIGVLALPVAYVAGFVFSGLQNVIVLAVVFALVVTAAMLGSRRIGLWIRLQPLLTLLVVVVVAVWAVLFLVSPAYITPMLRR